MVPYDKVGYVTQGYVSTDRAKIATFRVWALTPNGVRRVQYESTVSGGVAHQNFKPYAQVGPGVIMYIDAKVDQGNAAISGGIDYILIDLDKHT